jgi:hypothetical protein
MPDLARRALAGKVHPFPADPQVSSAYIGAEEEYVDLARRQSETLPCQFEVVPGDHFAAFAMSENVVPLVTKHIEASGPGSS